MSSWLLCSDIDQMLLKDRPYSLMSCEGKQIFKKHPHKSPLDTVRHLLISQNKIPYRKLRFGLLILFVTKHLV